MALTKEDILNAIAEMPVMELVELIEAAEEKFNVSAAAAVAVAGPTAGGDAAAAPPAAGPATATAAVASTPNFSSAASISSTNSITGISAIAFKISSLVRAMFSKLLGFEC